MQNVLQNICLAFVVKTVSTDIAKPAYIPQFNVNNNNDNIYGRMKKITDTYHIISKNH